MMKQFNTKQLLPYVVPLLCALLVALLLSKAGMLAGAALMVLPFVIGYVFLIFIHPIVGVYTSLLIAFFAIGLNRYVPGPLGLALDGNIVFTLLALLLNRKIDKSFKHLNNVAFVTAVLWFVYCFFELFNPLAVSKQAWFYAVRGAALYTLLATPLFLYLFKSRKDVWRFLHLWLILALIGSLWGIRQNVFGVDSAEARWLAEGGSVTHILFGKLRVFSFFSDAGQFGAAMGHAAVVAGILALGPVSVKRKLLYAAVCLICVYGLLISGTRGAFFVLAGGGMMFLLIIKNWKLFILGIFFGSGVFVFLKYTYIGQSNYNIARLRTALDPDDASFQVRLDNQKKLSDFMADKPFGNGIGSGGSWALRFSPNTFLADTPLDSWYVKIWAETGIVGLLLHLGCIFSIIFVAYPYVSKLEGKDKYICIALLSGFFGVVVAAYGNQIYGQAPTSYTIIFTIAALSLLKKWNKTDDKLLNS